MLHHIKREKVEVRRRGRVAGVRGEIKKKMSQRRALTNKGVSLTKASRKTDQQVVAQHSDDAGPQRTERARSSGTRKAEAIMPKLSPLEKSEQPIGRKEASRTVGHPGRRPFLHSGGGGDSGEEKDVQKRKKSRVMVTRQLTITIYWIARGNYPRVQ